MNFSPKHIQVWNPSLLSRTRWLYSNPHLPPPSRTLHKPLPGSRRFWELAPPAVCFYTHSTDPTVTVHHLLGLCLPCFAILLCFSILSATLPVGTHPSAPSRDKPKSGPLPCLELRQAHWAQGRLRLAIWCVPVYPTSTWACWPSCLQCLEGGSEDNQCSVKYLLKEKSWCAMLLTIITKIYT